MKSREEKSMLKYSRTLFESYPAYRVPHFRERRFFPEMLYSVLDDIHNHSSSLINISLGGASFEDRRICHIQIGSGPTQVLLWSQMHGDEPTATMAICDILRYFTVTHGESATQRILSSLKLHFIPMVNPDGAFRFQRRNAQNIDINRDALALQTPEARFLKELQSNIKPHFGFNLHDQELSTVGNTNVISAMSLLAPACDHEISDNLVRTRAKHLAATFNQILQEYIPGRVTKYDDSYEARAFGDNMQKWGTSTLLIESGHDTNEPEKESIRKLNFVGIISALFSVATDEYMTSDSGGYEELPLNGKRAYDVIIRNVTIEQSGKPKTVADLAVSYQVDTHSELPPKLVDAGDLYPFVGLKEIDATGKTISPDVLHINEPFDWEKYF
jgi:hypothetical protein